MPLPQALPCFSGGVSIRHVRSIALFAGRVCRYWWGEGTAVMTVLRFIGGLAAIGVVAVVVLAAVAAGEARQAQMSEGRIAAAEARAAALAGVAVRAQAYAGQITTVRLMGRGALDDLGTARVEMERALAELQRRTEAGISALGAVDQVRSELPEVDATRRMIELYHAIDAAANRALAAQRGGDGANATQLFTAEVQFRLSNELTPLIDNGMAGEASELESERAALAANRQIVLSSVVGIAGFAVVLLVALAVLAWRRQVRQEARLAAALEAVGNGDTVTAAGSDRLGRVGASLAVLHDRVAARQAALEAEAADLRAEMARRTEAWEAANAGLVATDLRRSQLLADISHQLRTPLTILRGEADVALRGAAPAGDLKAALERIQAQAEELGQLLEDLISYARADAERQQHAPADIRFDEVLGAAVREAQVLAEPREVTIATSLGDFGSLVRADQRQLRQALVIGFDNAIKHSPPGGRITVETGLGDGMLSVRIMDEGPGMAAEDRARVFERFYRGRGEAELFNAGLGIGLSIAREIVQRQGGRITLDNREAGGAVLEISLPALEPALP